MLKWYQVSSYQTNFRMVSLVSYHFNELKLTSLNWSHYTTRLIRQCKTFLFPDFHVCKFRQYPSSKFEFEPEQIQNFCICKNFAKHKWKYSLNSKKQLFFKKNSNCYFQLAVKNRLNSYIPKMWFQPVWHAWFRLSLTKWDSTGIL